MYKYSNKKMIVRVPCTHKITTILFMINQNRIVGYDYFEDYFGEEKSRLVKVFGFSGLWVQVVNTPMKF